MSRRKTTCEGCGCNCKDCLDSVGSLHLHVEIENLKQRLLERENHIVSMETNFLRETEKFPNGEMAALTDELLTWQDKYSRLYESHKRVQKVNQNLEDKLLRIVDKCETEKNILTAEVAVLTRRLVDEKFSVSKLQEENERYRNDVNLAIQLLQCKPSNFVPQKYDSLPNDLQQKVRSYVSSKRRMSVSDNQQKQPEMKTIKVPIPTFPPTAMVYSVNKPIIDREGQTSNGSGGNGEERNSKQAGLDIVSAAIMAKVLEERERERSQMKHCDTCSCPTGTNNTDNSHNNRQLNKETQTDMESKALLSNNSCDITTNDSIGNKSNTVEHHTLVNTSVTHGSKEHYIGCNSNINNIVSSPMNVKCSKFASNNRSVPISLVSPISLEQEAEATQIDFFTEFNMSPTVTSSTKVEDIGSAKTCNNSKKKLSNRIHNLKSLCDTDALLIGNQNDTMLINKSDVDSSHSCRVILENSKNCNNVCSNSSNNDSINNNLGYDSGNKDVVNRVYDNESDNLIIFDKPTQLSTSNVAVAVTPPPALTVLGGNLNVNASSNSRPGSVRHCSVRLQAGTSNILLDNVVDGPYAPVLYKSRPQSSCDPLQVHTSPPRSISASSSVSSFFNDSQSRYPSTDNVALSNNSGAHSSSSSTYSNSSSSSASSASSSLRKNNLLLAQIRTETEI